MAINEHEAPSRPLGVSWYCLERWISGKGIRNAASDTVLNRQLTPELCSKYNISNAAPVFLEHLSDDDVAALCVELDIGANGRAAQIAALNSPIVTTADVQRYVVAPRCLSHGRRSIVDSLQGTNCTETLWNGSIPATGAATVFVSHVWSYAFDEMLQAIDEYMCTVPLEKRCEVYVWLDVVCIDPFQAATIDSAGWAQTFSHMVKSIDQTLLVAIPALAPKAIKRSWVIFELLCTLQAQSQLTVVTSPREAASFKDVRGYIAAIATLADIDSRAAQATYAADKLRIDAAIEASGGFAQIDDAVRGRLLAELLSRALERGSEHFAEVRALCEAGASLETEVGTYRCAALSMASNPRAGLVERRMLKQTGRLEQTREADAEVVRYLLSLGAEVNSQSSKTGDTALINACRYGDRPTVLILLEANADPNLAQHGTNGGETAFLTAARWGAANVLEDLALAGADVNATAYSNYLERVGNAATWKNVRAFGSAPTHWKLSPRAQQSNCPAHQRLCHWPSSRILAPRAATRCIEAQTTFGYCATSAGATWLTRLQTA